MYVKVGLRQLFEPRLGNPAQPKAEPTKPSLFTPVTPSLALGADLGRCSPPSAPQCRLGLPRRRPQSRRSSWGRTLWLKWIPLSWVPISGNPSGIPAHASIICFVGGIQNTASCTVRKPIEVLIAWRVLMLVACSVSCRTRLDMASIEIMRAYSVSCRTFAYSIEILGGLRPLLDYYVRAMITLLSSFFCNFAMGISLCIWSLYSWFFSTS
jgi:hypothetical protein